MDTDYKSQVFETLDNIQIAVIINILDMEIAY